MARFNRSIFEQLLQNIETTRGQIERGENPGYDLQGQYTRLLGSANQIAQENNLYAQPQYADIFSRIGIQPVAPTGGGQPGGPVAPPVPPPVPRVTPPSEVDQGLVETEAARQEAQRRTQLSQLLGVPEAELGDLRGLLQRQQEETFRRRIPQIAEESQAGGLLRGSGFTDALAREAGQLETDTSLAFGQAGLGGLADALTARQGLQTAGLQRRFSLEDFERSARLAREIGATSAPAVQSGKGGSALSGAVGGASIGGSVGGIPGATIGGGVGLLTGALTGRKGK